LLPLGSRCGSHASLENEKSQLFEARVGFKNSSLLEIVMHFRMLVVVCLSTVASHAAIASEYADFLSDLAGPYAHYRQSLMLTSNPDNIDKATQSISQFSIGRKGIAE